MASAPRRLPIRTTPQAHGGAGAGVGGRADDKLSDAADRFDLEVVERPRSRQAFDGDAAQDSFAMEDPPSEEVRLDPRFIVEPATEVIDRDDLEAMRNEVTAGPYVSLPPSAASSVPSAGAVRIAFADVSAPAKSQPPGVDEIQLPTVRIDRDHLAALGSTENTVPTPSMEATVPAASPPDAAPAAPTPVDTAENRPPLSPPRSGSPQVAAPDEVLLDEPIGREPLVGAKVVERSLPPSEVWTGPSKAPGGRTPAPSEARHGEPTKHAEPRPHTPAKGIRTPAPAVARGPTPPGAPSRSRSNGPMVGLIAVVGSGGVVAAVAGLVVAVVLVVGGVWALSGSDPDTLPPIALPDPSLAAPTAEETPEAAIPPDAPADDGTAADPSGDAGSATPTPRRRTATPAPAPVEVVPEPEPPAPVEEVVDIEPEPEPTPEPDKKGGLFKRKR